MVVVWSPTTSERRHPRTRNSSTSNRSRCWRVKAQAPSTTKHQSTPAITAICRVVTWVVLARLDPLVKQWCSINSRHLIYKMQYLSHSTSSSHSSCNNSIRAATSATRVATCQITPWRPQWITSLPTTITFKTSSNNSHNISSVSAIMQWMFISKSSVEARSPQITCHHIPWLIEDGLWAQIKLRHLTCRITKDRQVHSMEVAVIRCLHNLSKLCNSPITAAASSQWCFPFSRLIISRRLVVSPAKASKEMRVPATLLHRDAITWCIGSRTSKHLCSINSRISSASTSSNNMQLR